MPAAAACRGSRGSPGAVPTLSMFSLGPRGHARDLLADPRKYGREGEPC